MCVCVENRCFGEEFSVSGMLILQHLLEKGRRGGCFLVVGNEKVKTGLGYMDLASRIEVSACFFRSWPRRSIFVSSMVGFLRHFRTRGDDFFENFKASEKPNFA